jgi:protocatechuate 3,4-dioxygenase beta subunit
MNRRQLLRLTVGAMAAGCGDGIGGDGEASDDSSGDDDTGGTPTGGGSCSAIPKETAGPYPGDGTNGANALVLTGIVRSDIRQSVGDSSGTAKGVALTVTLTIVDEACAPRAGHAVYVWHCDRDSDYSMYTGSAKGENYLRGVQETDADGKVTFLTIFPAAYSGRWPHIHFEVYPSLAGANDAGNRLRTSQLALPEGACDEVFAVAGYEASVVNLAQLDLDTDNVFSDGSSLQVADVSGDVDAGYTATLTVAV